MASHGAMKAEAADHPSHSKEPKKELRHVELKKAADGGVIAEHYHNVYDGVTKPFAFGSDEGHKLASHIETHLGIKMPGRAKSGVASSASGEAGKDED